jgi:hypothetical protein
LRNTGFAGIYDAKPPLTGAYMELKSDGTLYFHSQYDYGYSGTWKVVGSNRIYMKTDQGMTAYATIEGGTLTDDTGGVYVKR